LVCYALLAMEQVVLKTVLQARESTHAAISASIG
jgi:hypothetical protein